jgi:hypothetical protein
MYNPRYHNAQPQQQQVALPSVADMGAIVVRGVTTFAKRHKVISGSYLFGLIFLLLLGSGTKLSIDQRRHYNHIMNTIDINAEYDASNYYHQTVNAYRGSKGWFTCDHLCKRNKIRMDNAKAALDAIRNEGYARMSDAKKVAGLFSEVGVEEVKDSFWEYFHAGKSFAKRQSMWDAMFMGIRSIGRDESTMEYVLRVLVQVLINFSMGLLAALGVFIFGLWGIVKSYQPDPITAVIFFLGAACAAFAFVSTYLFAIYGAAAGGLYGMAKIVESNLRIEQGRRHQNVRNHPHNS